MSENKSVENGSQPAPSESGTASTDSRAISSLNKSQAIGVCAVGLFICFFLPWANFFGHTVSGYDLQKLRGNQEFLWLIPISCVITIIAGYLKQGQKAAAQFAGVLPFCALAYWVHELGVDAIKEMLAIGAYVGLALGLTLTVLSARLKKG